MTGEFKRAALPQTFGTEYAGMVPDVTRHTKYWVVGDRVLGSGGAFTHATIIDVPVANLISKPKNIDWSIAGTMQALRKQP